MLQCQPSNSKLTLGWYLGPSYGITFGNGNKKSVALTGGLFFAVP